MNGSDIQVTYGSHGEIALRSEGLDWNDHPLMVSPEQLRSIKPELVLSILKDIQTPSEKAGLDEKGLCAVAAAVDREFRENLTKYIDDLDVASVNDLKVLSSLEDITVGSVIWEGLCSLLRLNFGEFVYKTVAAQNVVTAKKLAIRKEGSTGRVMWLKEVETLEAKRLENAKRMLTERATVLIKKLKKSEQLGNVPTKRLKELDQLAKLFTALFPQGQFTVVTKGNGSENVSDFVLARKDLLI